MLSITHGIQAVVLHIGSDPTQGHYRCAVRSQGQWLIFEDGQLPEQIQQLTHEHETQICVLWVLHSDRNPLHPAFQPQRDGREEPAGAHGD